MSNPCVDLCMCINSVVYCDEKVCEDIGPIEGQNCTKVKKENQCCPQYECRKLQDACIHYEQVNRLSFLSQRQLLLRQ